MNNSYWDLARFRTREVRAGVVGMGGAGKTVFLTSLLNHIRDHEPDRFHLGDGNAVLRKFRELRPEPGWEAFDYPRCRDAFVHKKWPGKTRDRFQIVCSFERSDWTFSDVRLVLSDLPGERVADAVMLVHDHAGWSEHILQLLRNDGVYRACSADFLALGERPDARAGDLIKTYKSALVSLIREYKPYITPSTFLLDQQGRVNRPPPETDTFFVGLDRESEFTPLSASLRQAQPQLAEGFARSYHTYKESVVRPVIAALRSCHALVVLVDVTMLLAGGVGMYNDNRQIVLDLLDVIQPGETPLGRLHRQVSGLLLPYWLRPAGVTRVAFVAPKLDQVHPDDRDRMTLLLRRMFERSARDRDGLLPLFQNCAAVVSTEKMPSPPGERWLRCLPQYDERGQRLPPGEMRKVVVSELPDEWPTDWPAGRYSFPDVYPLMPPRKDAPPVQVNLDRILEFVLG